VKTVELRQLETFLVLCEELHFTKAAEKINISQPSLSQQIRALENEVGIPLFDRIGKKTSLTAAGQILLKHTQNVFYELEQARVALQELQGLQRGKLTIGCLLTVASYLLPPTVLRFHQHYPAIQLSVQGLRMEEIRQGLLKNRIVFLPLSDEALESIPLYREELALAVPANHELAQEKPAPLGILQTVPTILFPDNFYLRQLVDEHCRRQGFIPKPVLELSTLESIIHMVSQGLGVTVLPKAYLQYLNRDSIHVVSITNPSLTREIGIVYRKDKYMCAASRTFIEQLTATTTSMQT
jgi:LysR family cyn operon transcriptional activator